MISNCHGRANNKYMSKACDETKLTKYITYLDATNLYGWAICQSLPVRGFKWMTDLHTWQEISCDFEVNPEYLKELHDLHNDYPLVPERLNEQ